MIKFGKEHGLFEHLTVRTETYENMIERKRQEHENRERQSYKYKINENRKRMGLPPLE